MMTVAATCLAAAALLCAVAAGGCGFGPGDAAEGRAELRVTREFGTVPMVDATLERPDRVGHRRPLPRRERRRRELLRRQLRRLDRRLRRQHLGRRRRRTGSSSSTATTPTSGRGRRRVRAGRPDLVGLPLLVGRLPGAGGRRLLAGAVPARLRRRAAGHRPRVRRGRLAQPAPTVVVALKAAGIDFAVDEPRRPVEHPDELRILVGTWDALGDDAAASPARDRARTRAASTRASSPAATATELVVDDDHGRPAAPARRRRPRRRRPRRRGPADLGRDRYRRRGRRCRGRLARAPTTSATATRSPSPAARPSRHRRPPIPTRRRRGVPMRSVLAYSPRPGPLGQGPALDRRRLPRAARGHRVHLRQPDRPRRRRLRRRGSPASSRGRAAASRSRCAGRSGSP